MLFNPNLIGRTERIWASNNPCGIEINLGYYALAECIICGTYTSNALLKWCGLSADVSKPRKKHKYTPRKYVAPDKAVNQRVIELYLENPNMQNKEIAAIVGRSNTFVHRMLKTIGVRRQRWDNHRKEEE